MVLNYISDDAETIEVASAPSSANVFFPIDLRHTSAVLSMLVVACNEQESGNLNAEPGKASGVSSNNCRCGSRHGQQVWQVSRSAGVPLVVGCLDALNKLIVPHRLQHRISEPKRQQIQNHLPPP